MFCLKCEKKTETTNEREEKTKKGIWVLKGECSVCNTNKAKKLLIFKKHSI